jgi:hypothetical protein
VSDNPNPRSGLLKREAAIFLAMLFFGLVILPVAIWFVGNTIFGDYGGAGYGDFYGNLTLRIVSGNLAAWFLVLSPWLTLQAVRLALAGWRRAGKL